MLFSRCVSGTRAVPRGKRLEVGGIVFEGYGAHHDRCAALPREALLALLTGAVARSYPHPYLTAAAALGTTHADIDAFCARLRKCFVDARKRAQKTSAAA